VGRYAPRHLQVALLPGPVTSPNFRSLVVAALTHAMVSRDSAVALLACLLDVQSLLVC
jgi:hypothetical protein